MKDHLAALFFTPAAPVGRGTYLPGRFDLRLRGDAGPGDRLVHYHEAQHVTLTATTAWGAALLASAEMPGWQRLFGKLLDRCRTTHESFATYLSCSVVAIGFGWPDTALAAYPEYAVLADRLHRFLTPVSGEQRRALAVTAIARACMQTPILDRMIASWPEVLTMGSLPRLDVPDERLEYLLKDPDLPATAGAADAAVTEQFGTAALDADLAGGSGALDDAHDPAWALWENTLFDRVASKLRAAGAVVLGSNDHLDAAAELTALVVRALPGARLTVDAAPDAADRRLTGIALSHARLWLRTMRLPGRLVTIGEDVDLDEVVRVADATSRLEGRPNLVLSARLSARLLAGYEYDKTGAEALSALREPVVGIRSLADDGAGSDTDAVWFARLPRTADAAALARALGGRGDLSCCVAASCLAYDRWREAWLSALLEVGPLVWLIDVDVSLLTRELCGGSAVYGLYLDLGPSPFGIRRSAVFKVTGGAGVWLAIADEAGIEMLVQEVARLPGIDLRMTGGEWAQEMPTIQLVLLDLLRTESYVDLRGHLDEAGP